MSVMRVDLSVDITWNGLIAEPRKQRQPIMQFESVLLVSQVLVECRYDINKASHDVGEKGHTAQENQHAQKSFGIRLR